MVVQNNEPIVPEIQDRRTMECLTPLQSRRNWGRHIHFAKSVFVIAESENIRLQLQFRPQLNTTHEKIWSRSITQTSSLRNWKTSSRNCLLRSSRPDFDELRSFNRCDQVRACNWLFLNFRSDRSLKLHLTSNFRKLLRDHSASRVRLFADAPDRTVCVETDREKLTVRFESALTRMCLQNSK